MRNLRRGIGLWILAGTMLVGCATTNANEATPQQPTSTPSGEPASVSAGTGPSEPGTPDALCEAALPAPDPTTREYSQAEQVLQAGVDYRAIFCTETGAIYIDLFEDFAPVTVNNFVFLAQNNYYNNLTFHRVLQDFMAQGGDPTGTGSGGPGYEFEDEFVGFLHFDRVGLLAMANAGPATNGSQFFITTAVTDWLNYRHTIFGEVLSGGENAVALPLRDPQTAAVPGPHLDTVIIITDPALVEVDAAYPPRAEQADAEQVIAALPELQGLVMDAQNTGVKTRDSAIGTFPEAVREAAGAVLSEEAFAVTVAHDNAACDLQTVPLMRIEYTLHAFPDTASAGAVLTNDDLALLVTRGEEFQTEDAEELDYPLYSRTVSACGMNAIEARTYWQRGRYVAVISAIIPEESQATPAQWVGEIAGIQYEFLLSDILRPEIWGS